MVLLCACLIASGHKLQLNCNLGIIHRTHGCLIPITAVHLITSYMYLLFAKNQSVYVCAKLLRHV